MMKLRQELQSQNRINSRPASSESRLLKATRPVNTRLSPSQQNMGEYFAGYRQQSNWSAVTAKCLMVLAFIQSDNDAF